MGKITPWIHNVPITDKEQKPTPEFMRWLFNQLKINQDLGTAVPQARLIDTEGGLQGGGDLTSDRTLSLTDTGVVAGTYGSATTSPKITIDEKGRVTNAENVPISGGGGGSQPWWYKPPKAIDFPILGSVNANMPLLTDDTDIGLIGSWVGSSLTNDSSMGFFKNLPSGDWEATTRFIFFSPADNYLYGGIAIRNTANNRAYTINQTMFGYYPMYAILGQTGWTGQNVNNVLHSCVIQPHHIKIKYNSASQKISVYMSPDGKKWILEGNFAISSYLLNAPDLIGFKLHTAISDSISGHEPYLVIDRWEQSW